MLEKRFDLISEFITHIYYLAEFFNINYLQFKIIEEMSGRTTFKKNVKMFFFFFLIIISRSLEFAKRLTYFVLRRI